MAYQILALDLDGTLTNSQKEITKPTLDALIEIQEAGKKLFSPADARQKVSFRWQSSFIWKIMEVTSFLSTVDVSPTAGQKKQSTIKYFRLTVQRCLRNGDKICRTRRRHPHLHIRTYFIRHPLQSIHRAGVPHQSDADH